MRNLFLGIDLGTSSLKTLILEPDTRRVLAQAAVEYQILTPHPGWAEQDPQTWIRALLNCLKSVLVKSQFFPEQIAAIGLTGQMHGTVCIDEDGLVIRPAIIWADQRSHAQVRQVYTQQGVEKLGKATGNPLATGFMLPTLLWMRDNEPDLYHRISRVLLPKDYLRFEMTGSLGSEPSDASSTGLFNPVSRDWNQTWTREFNISTDFFPPISPSHSIAGTLSAKFAELSGLREGTPVIFGASDQSAQALGNGIIKPGDVSCTIGTGGQIFAPVLTPSFDPQLRLHFFCHALPDSWHLEAATLSAGLSLKWLRDLFFEDRTYQQLVDEAALAQPGADGLVYLPYLAGERTPIMDPMSTASFTGLTLRHQRRHLVRAVLEGVVFSLKQGLDLIQSLGAPIERVVASGGGTKHPFWLRLQADIFNRPIYRSTTTETAAMGAAMLAAVGSGCFLSFDEACQQLAMWNTEVIEPDVANIDVYQHIYERYCQMYPMLKASYPTL